MPTPTKTVQIIRHAKPIPYRTAYAAQIDRRNDVEADRAPNTLFLLEHEPVFTLGRKSEEGNILRSPAELAKLGIDVVEVDRGGDVTYHGPGQLVGYPILDLQQWTPSVNWYLRRLEEVLIALLAGYGLLGERMEGYTGVWVDGAKVAAIGVGIHNWVTFHGISLNVDSNMEHWALIVPCGIPDKPVTSLAQLMASPPTMDEAMDAFEVKFKATFEIA